MIKNISLKQTRKTCYICYRPQTSCMCEHISAIDTKTKFVILMHNKEFRKTKNGTGHFTNLSLNNCELFVGFDFSNHNKINSILNDVNNSCYLLYPHKNSINLNTTNIQKASKTNVIFIIDSTWACAKTLLYDNTNLQDLPKISFTHTKNSAFEIKEQPADYCLSTIESTLCVLELLNHHKIENINKYSLNNFLKPFSKMVDYQKSCLKSSIKNVRYKIPSN